MQHEPSSSALGSADAWSLATRRPWYLPGWYFAFELGAALSTVARARTLAAAYTASGLRHFGVVVPRRLYRAAEPRSALQWRHVEELGVRTLLCVKRTPIRPATIERARASRIRLACVDLGRDGRLDRAAIDRAVDLALDPAAAPVLVHCDGGRHRAGIVCAEVRRRSGVTLGDALAEYDRFARPTPRPGDRATIISLWRSR